MKKVKRFLYRLKRFLDWLPVIWNDADFDYAYCTRWLFKQVGIEIDYKQFKAMLVWDWS